MKKIIKLGCLFFYEHKKKIIIMQNIALFLIVSISYAASGYSQVAKVTLD